MRQLQALKQDEANQHTLALWRELTPKERIEFLHRLRKAMNYPLPL